jgi:hypothetical protein
MSQVMEAGTPVNLSATGIVSETAGTLLGFYVNSTSGGTIVISVGGAAAATTGGTAISGTITPAVGFHRFPAYCTSRCYVTIAVAALNVTLVFAAG